MNLTQKDRLDGLLRSCKKSSSSRPPSIYLNSSAANKIEEANYSSSVSNGSQKPSLFPSQNQKLCEILQQLITTADAERQKLANSANLNMPFKNEKLSNNQSHSRNNTFSYSEEETNKTIEISSQNREDQLVKQLREEITQLKQNKLEQEQDIQRMIKNNGQLRSQLQEQREFYQKKIMDLEKDRECLQEVLKNFLLQRELDKFRKVNDESMESIESDLLKQVESKSISNTDIKKYLS